MADFVTQLRRKEKAEEDRYFAKRDQELIERFKERQRHLDVPEEPIPLANNNLEY
ncbi:hypothetical protein [Motilimonas eburnea]|uniref:hypothetical protein n=1 Tax=Motilimonas eburnea TaxID=1737488 RepID=UPI001E47919D|nr:hypothetical protein [Motilimonas eburnea]MCE2572921.1 hypothetical protein [Motilimonas eburnea]